MIKNDVDIEAILAENSEVTQSKFNGGRYNKTSLFALPMIEMHYKMRWLSKFMKNAFLDDGAIEHDFIRPIFVLMKVKDQQDKDWQDFCQGINTISQIKPLFITDYYIGQEDGHSLLMYVFTVSEKWSGDFELFKNGQYSKMSDKYKKMFPKDVYLSTGGKKESQVWGALYKSDNLKDAVVKEFINPKTSTVEEVITFRRDMDSWDEIWDKPHAREEVYRYKDNKEDANTNTIEAKVSSDWANSET